jgi:hypothetical protein
MIIILQYMLVHVIHFHETELCTAICLRVDLFSPTIVVYNAI